MPQVTGFVVAFVGALLITQSAAVGQETGTPLEALYAEYRAAWLGQRGDIPTAVMALFSDDAALLPHHGDPIVSPKSAIASHWFPGGAMSGRVDLFEQDVRRVEVHGDLGYLYARFRLRFAFGQQSFEAAGNQLLVARRIDGSWRIEALIWNDPPARPTAD